jgi:protein-S-isoprenylcysteine O-methyltransferase Ste14
VVATPRRMRFDTGRLIMVSAAIVILIADFSRLGHGAASGAVGVLRVLGAVLVMVFYAVMIWCYLRRGPAIATSASVSAHAAALAATWLPFALPLLHGASPTPAVQALSDVLLVCGTSWSVWSLRFLGRNVSVLAQARDVVDRGPYRWVRHPLYAGEIVSSLGVAIAMNTLAAVAFWLALCALQVYRALREEQVLLQALPAYRSYRRRTAALLPGVFWRRRLSRPTSEVPGDSVLTAPLGQGEPSAR